MMTDGEDALAASITKDLPRKSSVFEPLKASHSLTHQLIQRLTRDITSGKLRAGSKLPTEQEMIASTGVSRTVVREAVAALRSEGLVVTRQGIGSVVADAGSRPFRISFDEKRTLREVLDVAELRTGVEIEAAGMAAERASAVQVKKIENAYKAIQQAIQREEAAVDEDFAFHRAIAEATGNPQFLRFLDFLGRFIIPRQTVHLGENALANRRAYLEGLQKEHRDIVAAIRAHSVTKARAAMRRHLLNSRKRYQRIAKRMADS
jgi:GntR family transcriptional repressor for pyruvate dehydrogenase complex